MKTKGILAVVLAALLSFGAGIGTLAYYQSTFTSSGDFESEEWDVTADGIKTGMEFEKTFSNLDLAPGRAEGYGFTIRRNETDLNYVIKVTVEKDGELFEAQGTLPSPVLVKLGSGSATPMPVTAGAVTEVINTGAGADAFTLNVVWPWETPSFVDPLTGNSYDNLWANKTGEVTVKVVVEQEKEFGTPATMRVRMKPAESAYAAVALKLGDTSGLIIDKTITGRMEIVGTNVTFVANDSELGVVELHNKLLSFTTIGANVNLNSVYNIGINADANITSVNTQTWLNFID